MPVCVHVYRLVHASTARNHNKMDGIHGISTDARASTPRALYLNTSVHYSHRHQFSVFSCFLWDDVGFFFSSCRLLPSCYCFPVHSVNYARIVYTLKLHRFINLQQWQMLSPPYYIFEWHRCTWNISWIKWARLSIGQWPIIIKIPLIDFHWNQWNERKSLYRIKLNESAERKWQSDTYTHISLIPSGKHFLRFGYACLRECKSLCSLKRNYAASKWKWFFWVKTQIFFIHKM